MRRSGRPHIASMLEAAKQHLDGIFGASSYTIENTGEYSALLTTKLADFEFTDDPRDFVAASIIRIPAVGEIYSSADTWMKFLGEEIPLQNRAAPYGEQLASELKWVTRVVDEILVDPARAQDAAWFIKGYNQAYNDWASGSGSWTEVDF